MKKKNELVKRNLSKISEQPRSNEMTNKRIIERAAETRNKKKGNPNFFE